MNDQTPTSEQRAERLQGVGCKRKRVEDIRFVQGKGNYVDDMKLPGMLYGDFNRSPHAHARIKKIDTSKAKAVPGVLAVLTAADLKPLSLHYMPTLAGDVAAVLAEEKVLYQNQEVAFVIATERYAAADARTWSRSNTKGCRSSSIRSRRWRRTHRCCAKTSRTRRTARTASANITTTSSTGRSATRMRPTPPSERRRDDQGADLLPARSSKPA
jgi:Aerobic-type carbon monoxide dehydrogenase, large subunit CoxL/CutL homologs